MNLQLKFISNDVTIIIVEDKNFQDNSYYDSLIKNKNFEDMIIIRLTGSINADLYFPSDITFSEMLKVIYFKFDRDNKNLFLDYSCDKVNDEIKEIFGNRKNVCVSAYFSEEIIGGIVNIYGKQIYLHFDDYSFSIGIGILNSNKKLIKDIENHILKKVKKLYIEEKELNIQEEKSLLSFGIKKDCYNCKVEFDDKIYL